MAGTTTPLTTSSELAINTLSSLRLRVIQWELYLRKRDGLLEELGRTEVTPAWIEKISLAYHFETVQHLAFHVYDADTKYYNLPETEKTLKPKDQEFLGESSYVLSKENPLVIECFDFNTSGKHALIGVSFWWINFVRSNSTAFLITYQVGFELTFTVAVDFTASNGNPINPDSLYYIDHSGRYNSYQQAKLEVGEVIQFYESDRRFY